MDLKKVREFASKLILPFSSAIFGAVVVAAGLYMSPYLRTKLIDKDRRELDRQVYDDPFHESDGIRRQFDSFFDDDFGSPSEPFQMMKKMHEQMEKRLENLAGQSGTMVHSTLNDISEREDDAYVYYDIKVSDINSTSVRTNVENGYVTISGTVEKKSGSELKEGDSSMQSVFKSSFNRTFPLPENVDGHKMQMLTEKDKVVLKFPKIKA